MTNSLASFNFQLFFGKDYVMEKEQVQLNLVLKNQALDVNTVSDI